MRHNLGKMVLIGGLFALSLDVHAATRTVTFAGSSNIPYLSAGFSDQARYGYCTVVVSNLGQSSQKITKVSFLQTKYSGSNVYSELSEISSSNDQFMVTPTAASSTSTTSTCINQTLPKNGYCVFIKRMNTVAVGGIRNISCSGRVTVEDLIASQPGSVLASGSVVTLQESVVLGGLLSAAHYYGSPNYRMENSRNAYFDSLPSNKPSELSSLMAPTEGGGTGQMNLSCYAGCMTQIPARTLNRELLCEGYCGYMGPVEPGAHYLGHYPTNPSPSPSVSTSPGNSSYPPESLGFNSLYSGGIVHEMIMGPFLSICSGNKSFKAEGGVEFSHAEVSGMEYRLDNYSIGTVDYSGGIPERLHCMHRHGMEDLYSRVGSASAFAINGGSPF